MANTIDAKLGAEQQAQHPAEKSEVSTIPKEIQQSTAEQLAEIIVTVEQVSEAGQVYKVLSQPQGGGTAATASRKQLIQQQIAKVQTMSEQQLVQGIKKELQQEISKLQHEAHKIQRSVMQFSAYELTTIVTKIRALKEQMAGLIHLAIEKLRELYITLVLKLKLVTV